MVKYLVDSLAKCENSHGDALSPVRQEMQISFMGDHAALQPVTRNDLHLFINRIISEVRIQPQAPPSVSGAATEIPTSSSPPLDRDLGSTRATTAALASLTNTMPAVAAAISQPRSAAAASSPLPIPNVRIQNLSRNKGAWREALRQWNQPLLEHGNRPLKDWPEEWYKGDMRKITGSKRSMRQLIAMEYERCVLFSSYFFFFPPLLYEVN